MEVERLFPTAHSANKQAELTAGKGLMCRAAPHGPESSSQRRVCSSKARQTMTNSLWSGMKRLGRRCPCGHPSTFTRPKTEREARLQPRDAPALRPGASPRHGPAAGGRPAGALRQRGAQRRGEQILDGARQAVDLGLGLPARHRARHRGHALVGGLEAEARQHRGLGPAQQPPALLLRARGRVAREAPQARLEAGVAVPAEELVEEPHGLRLVELRRGAARRRRGAAARATRAFAVAVAAAVVVGGLAGRRRLDKQAELRRDCFQEARDLWVLAIWLDGPFDLPDSVLVVIEPVLREDLALNSQGELLSCSFQVPDLVGRRNRL
mmetsp:Transcript_27432/g.55443  ORF Transcript_27432/g.55443 Transcript_27432/m.55443 type:complete len:325 (-) Transcript_27432:163-1137(-)